MFDIIESSPTEPDALLLLSELNSTLSQMTGDSGELSFDVVEFIQTQGVFIMAYSKGEPVACGALRRVDDECGEIKRMYSRVKGGGTMILNTLIEKAIALTYQKLVLSTRRVNHKAVAFYRSGGFQETAPYGKYNNQPQSICMAKLLAS